MGEATECRLHWECFCQAVRAAHPEWAPFLLGPVAGHGTYRPDDVRYFLEIPSTHPTIQDPLIVEVSSPGGPIDIYWFRFFEHVFAGKEPVQSQFQRVIQKIEDWLDPTRPFLYDADSDTHFVPFRRGPVS